MASKFIYAVGLAIESLGKYMGKAICNLSRYQPVQGYPGVGLMSEEDAKKMDERWAEIDPDAEKKEHAELEKLCEELKARGYKPQQPWTAKQIVEAFHVLQGRKQKQN